MDVVNNWDLDGLAIWRMGMEDPLAWDSIGARVVAER